MQRARHQYVSAGRAAGHTLIGTSTSSRTATHDPRWPVLATALQGLRDEKRHAVRIVDADCGAGCLLLHAMRHARALGFTAIEGRGIDGSPALVGRARAAAARLGDPAIGVVFELGDMVEALREEHDMPADIVLCHDTVSGELHHDFADALSRAGDVVIGDAPAGLPRKTAV